MSEPGEWLEGNTAKTYDGKLDAVLVVRPKVERGRHMLEGPPTGWVDTSAVHVIT